MVDILEYGRINGSPNISQIAFSQYNGYMKRHTLHNLLTRTLLMCGIPLWYVLWLVGLRDKSGLP
jgi:hypothetical protein